MFNKSKFSDVRCIAQMMFVCKMRSRKNGFKNEMRLSDHLYNIEKNILDLKLNITLIQKLIQTSTEKILTIETDSTETSSRIKSTTTA